MVPRGITLRSNARTPEFFTLGPRRIYLQNLVGTTSTPQYLAARGHIPSSGFLAMVQS